MFAPPPSRIVGIIPAVLCCSFAVGQCPLDRDCDGIPDSFEQQLLDTFAPVIVSDQGCPGVWQSRVPVPVEPSWFLRNGFLIGDTGQVAQPGNIPIRAIYSTSPTLSQAIKICKTPAYQALLPSFNIGFNDGRSPWGYSSSAGDSCSWQSAVANRSGVFGRVWRPWPQCPSLYSVQYYMLLSANRLITTDAGYHDGDWLCLDFGVDAAAPGGPQIIHGIYHNHGKQILLTPNAIEIANGHPVAYLEPGANEPWPNASTNAGYESWPLLDGFAKNWLWQGGPFGIGNEEDVTTRHAGSGCRYLVSTPDRPVRNLGERGLPITQGGEEEFVLIYPGKWGVEAGGTVFGRDDARNPEGPAFQRKLWDREFTFSGSGDFTAANAAPFSRLEDPLRPDLDRTLRFQTDAYGCDNDNDGFLYFRCGTLFLPIAYVQAGATGRQEGLRTRPLATLADGISRVAPRGILRLYPGTIPIGGPTTLSKPMVIESFGGPSTIR